MIKNSMTKQHCITTSHITDYLVSELKMKDSLKKEFVQASLLHDVGKNYIPDELLNKKDKLSPLEKSQIDMHSIHGYIELKNKNYSNIVCGLVLLHHGFNKPATKNFIAHEIKRIDPLVIKHFNIIMTADIYSALRVDRSYRKKMSHDEAILILKKEPEISNRLIEIINKMPQEIIRQP